MPLYTYKVKNETGKLYTGELKMDSEAALRKLLLEKGYTPIEIMEKNVFTDVSQIGIFKQKVKLKDLAMFARQFSIILEAGVPIAGALDVLKEQTTNRTLKEVLGDIYENIQKGLSLSSSMKQHSRIFPEVFLYMVEAGEISGQLDLVFKRIANQYEKDYKLQQKVKGAMTYPIIVCIVSVIVIFILMLKVLPIFVEVLEGLNVELPLLSRIVIGVSDFFSVYWWLIGIALIGLGAFLATSSRTYRGKRILSILAIKIPVLSMVVKNVMTARLTRTLGTLTASGVLLIQALEVTQKVLGNVIVSEKLDEVIEEIKKGRGLTQPLKSIRYFPPMVISMIRIGEESGSLDFSLDKSADFYDEEVESSMQQLTTILEPVIIMILAVIVAAIVLSVLLPMFSIYQNIQ